jgi:hypothetical protein
MKMKFLSPRVFLFVSFQMINIILIAPSVNSIFILVSEPVKPFDRLLKSILLAESSGDTLAFNIEEGAVGGLQIRPIRLLDYNQRTGKNYNMEDCLNYQTSKEIFLFYATISGTDDYELIARKWNGSGCATSDYWYKVKALLDNQTYHPEVVDPPGSQM